MAAAGSPLTHDEKRVEKSSRYGPLRYARGHLDVIAYRRERLRDKKGVTFFFWGSEDFASKRASGRASKSLEGHVGLLAGLLLAEPSSDGQQVARFVSGGPLGVSCGTDFYRVGKRLRPRDSAPSDVDALYLAAPELNRFTIIRARS